MARQSAPVLHDQVEWESHYDQAIPRVGLEKVGTYDRRDPYLKRLCDLAKISTRSLEFGSGKGGCSLAAKRANPRMEAVLLDFSIHAVAFSRLVFHHNRSSAGFVAGSFLALPFGDGQFDLVTGHTVLEHVRDSEHAVSELVRVTKPGGHLLITVPNRNRRFDHDLYHVANNLKYYSRTFSASELTSLFERHGCDIVDFFGEGLLFMPPSLVPRYVARRLRGATMATLTSSERAVSHEAEGPRRGSRASNVKSLVRALDEAVLYVEGGVGKFMVSRNLIPSRWLITIGIVARKRAG